MTLTLILILTIICALIFNITNGWNDAANAIATVVATRVLSPVTALLFGASLNFLGALFSSEVAKTVGSNIAQPDFLRGNETIFLTASMIAPIWIVICSTRGLPISCSHALLGGLIGSVFAAADFGLHGLKMEGIMKILTGVIVAPVASFVLGYLIMLTVSWLFQKFPPRSTSSIFGKLQLISAGAMAFAHGTGDAQKAMGIITGALMASGHLVATNANEFPIPLWVRLACALTMGLGTAFGGWAVMRTLGSRLAHLKTHQGFSAETAAASTILVSTLSGIPMSTTHSITGSIMGVGSSFGVKTVRWGVGKKIVFAWIFTFPVCILGGAGLYKALHPLVEWMKASSF